MNLNSLRLVLASSTVFFTFSSSLVDPATAVKHTTTTTDYLRKLPPGLKDPLENLLRSPKQSTPPRKFQSSPRVTLPPLWVRQIGTTKPDVSREVVLGPRGNVFTTGYTRGKLGAQQFGGDDAWVAKYSPAGKVLWKKQLGTTGDDQSFDVAVDRQGNGYATGYTEGKLGNQKFGGDDAWVAKYSPAGKVLWKKQLGTTGDDSSLSIATDSRGNAYLAGVTDGKLGDQQYGKTDAWLAKYGPAGKILWKKQLGTAFDESATNITVDSSGFVYLTGFTDGKLGDQQYGGADIWMAKYSAAGELQWVKQFGTSADDVSYSIILDRDGAIYLAGFTGGKLGGQQYGGADAWLAKYSSAGDLQWSQQLGTTAPDVSTGIAVDARGTVYLSGFTGGQLGTQFYGGALDAWVAQYSPAGTLQRITQIGTPANDAALAITTDRSGAVHLAGFTNGKLGNQQFGLLDAWLAKYNP
jgi:hypothetical protein